MHEMKRYARALVMISTELGKERDIVAPTGEEVMDVVLDKVGRISGVKDTHTIIPTHSFTKTPE